MTEITCQVNFVHGLIDHITVEMSWSQQAGIREVILVLKTSDQSQPCFTIMPTHLRDVFRVEVDDRTDKIVSHRDAADRFPIVGDLAQHGARRFERKLDKHWRIGHGPHLN